MTQPTGSTRKLNYPLNRSEDMESETPLIPEGFLSLEEWSTTDSDERVDVVMNLSLNEYIAIANVVDVGRDIAYGDNSLYIWWVWIRMLKSMDICDSIINCINDPESGVAEAINNVVSIPTFETSVATAQSENQTSLGAGFNPTCDRDILWGQVTQLVDYLDQLNVDCLEILEVATNGAEFISEVIGDITIIDETSLDAVLAWVTKLQDDIAENYVAQVTVAYKDEIACDMFCRAYLQGCAVTPDLMFNVFKDRLTASVTIESIISNTLDYLVGGAWSGSEIADFLFMSQLGFRSQVGKWLGINAFADIDLRMRIFSNDPDSDWSTVCDECVETWEQVFDFTITEYSEFIVQNDIVYQSTWQSSLGYVGAKDALGSRGGITIILPEERTLTFAECTNFIVNTATNTRQTGVRLYPNDTSPYGTAIADNTSEFQGTGSTSREVEGDFEGVNAVQVYNGSRNGSSSSSRIASVTLRGEGTNPFT